MVQNNFGGFRRQGPRGAEFSKSRYLCPSGLLARPRSTRNPIPVLTPIPTFATGFPYTKRSVTAAGCPTG